MLHTCNRHHCGASKRNQNSVLSAHAQELKIKWQTNGILKMSKETGTNNLRDFCNVSVRKVEQNTSHDRTPLKFSRVPRGYWSNAATQRDELEKLGIQMGIKQLDDWYSVDAATVKNSLGFIKDYYNGSLYTVLKEFYPQHNWDPLSLTRVPRGYWKDIDTQRDALEKVGMKLGVKQLDDWYSVDATAVKKELSFISNYYNSSLYLALKELYPRHDWDRLKFSRIPQGHWKDIDTQRDALEKLGKQLGVKQLDDWYSADAVVVKNELSFIMSIYNSSLYNALKQLYPQHDWDPLKFTRAPQGYWKDIDTQRNALEKLGQQLGVKQLDDWYSVDAAAVKKELSFIMGYYHSSLYNALKELYPQHDWNPSKFNRVPQGYWKDTDTQRDALEKLGMKLGVKQLDDWYSVDATAVKKELSFIMSYYQSSLCNALKKLYPQHDWDPLKFTRAPQGYWKDIDTQRDALEKLGMKLGVKQLDDWYSVDTVAVKNVLSAIMSYYNGSLYTALKNLYPQHAWDPLKLPKVPNGYWQQPSTVQHFHTLFREWKKEHNIQRLRDWYQLPPEQVRLFQRVANGIFGTVTKMLREWFPDTNWMDEVQGSAPEVELQTMLRLVVENIKVHHRIGQHTVDIFIPEWKLAIEYQGMQHYQDQTQQQRDGNKAECLLQQGITLVPISYHWNGTWSQLRSTLRAARIPQLL